MSDDSVDGFIDSYGPVVVAGDLGAAQGRGSDRLGPYETAVSASITVPHDMTDTSRNARRTLQSARSGSMQYPSAGQSSG